MSDDAQSEHTTALQASRKKFETVFEYANDAIFIVDLENDSIVDCNPAAEELVEYSQDELQSMPASDLHPHNLSEFQDFVETVSDQGHGWTDEITCYCKSGDIIPAEMSASLVELDGRSHLINHVRNTTDREERDWFEALIEHSSGLITVIKQDGAIRYQSPSVDQELGYSPDELRDENFFELIHPDDRQKVRTIFEGSAHDTPSITEQLEYRFRRADGSWAWLASVGSHRPDSPVSGFIINSQEITSRTESRQQAAVLNRVLRHNLRNSLNVILGHAETLAETDSERIATRAETIASHAHDLHQATSHVRVLADLLDTQHVSQKRHEITELVEKQLASIRDDYPDIDVTFDLPAEQYITGAPKLDVALEHVFQNAVEHNDSEVPQITVTVQPPRSTDGYVDLTVADNGPGIPEDEQEVLIEGEENPLKHGTGLGLWIVNWIVTRSGGRLRFDENEPRGSRVTIALPSAE